MSGHVADYLHYTIRLRTGVKKETLSGGQLVVFFPGGNPLRVSPTVDVIWHRLLEGVTVDELCSTLAHHYPKAGNIRERTVEFVRKLGNAGLLEDVSVQSHPLSVIFGKEIQLYNLDPIATWVARCMSLFPPLFRTIFAMALILVAGAGVVKLLLDPTRPHILDVLDHFSAVGFIFMVTVGVLLHEAGHAVACRLAGIGVGHLCIRAGLLGWMRPFVETPDVFLVTRRLKRFQIAAGGVFFDLLICGATGWFLLTRISTGMIGSAAQLIFLYSLMNVDLGTSPVVQGDGSNMLAAILDDNFAGRTAISGVQSQFAVKKNVMVYRTIAIFHLLLTAVVLWRIY